MSPGGGDRSDDPRGIDARSGLPKSVERRMVDRDTAIGRVGASAALRALSVLVRHHPRAALHAAGAGIAQAARAGASEMRRRLPSFGSEAKDEAASSQSDRAEVVHATDLEPAADRSRGLEAPGKSGTDEAGTLAIDKRKLRRLERALSELEEDR